MPFVRHASLVVLFLVSIVAASGCLGPSETARPPPDDPRTQRDPPPPPAPDPQAGEVVRFLVLGDQGTGTPAQHRVAAAMLSVCEELGCDFVVGTGDNIYEVGVTSHYDPQFLEKFEAPYAAFDIPFYMTLGNHDNGLQREAWALGDFQVAYAQRTDRPSEKWQMPARHYKHEHGALAFFALDTYLIFGQRAALGKDPEGAAQAAWLARELPARGATWTFAHAHYPYISNGQHGNAAPELRAWFEATICDKVDVFFAGHEHDLQWLAPVPSCGATHFVISGGGAKTRPLADPSRNEAYFQKGDTLGFVWASVEGETLALRFYDGDANLLHEGTIERAA